MSNYRIELLGNYEEAVGEYAPGEKYSHVQFTTKEKIHQYGGIENALYSIFDHNVLEEIEGYRIYDQAGIIQYMDNFCEFESIERIVKNYH